MLEGTETYVEKLSKRQGGKFIVYAYDLKKDIYKSYLEKKISDAGNQKWQVCLDKFSFGFGLVLPI